MILYTHEAGLQIRYVRAHGCGMFHVHDLNPEKTISWCMSRVELFKLGLKTLWASIRARGDQIPDYPWNRLNNLTYPPAGVATKLSDGVHWHCQAKRCYKPSQCMRAEECLAGQVQESTGGIRRQ